jgi:transcriptional regulator with XRE-family HTH domain
MDGQELREKRKSRGLGQRELAKLSGVSQREISGVESGRKRARDKVAKRLSEALKK